MDPQNLPQRVAQVRARIAAAAAAAGRSADSVTLLGVGKGQPPEMLAAALAAGVTDLGESYLDEALGKIAALRHAAATWHFIGRVQANKTRAIAQAFDWVHGIERLKIAERLAAQRPADLPPLNVCLQVNLAGEASKAGSAPEEIPALLAAVARLPHLAVRGLMCLPPAESEPQRQRAWFAQLRRLKESLDAGGARLDTLSMGMSDDFESAIAEGATVVRLGTVLFGPRPVQ